MILKLLASGENQNRTSAETWRPGRNPPLLQAHNAACSPLTGGPQHRCVEQ
uniref:Uncharacterized protein n=1 Tax=Anguilla anguilla TaxID=7936 RepID=A0A0E9V6H4_ANGAN